MQNVQVNIQCNQDKQFKLFSDTSMVGIYIKKLRAMYCYNFQFCDNRLALVLQSSQLFKNFNPRKKNCEIMKCYYFLILFIIMSLRRQNAKRLRKTLVWLIVTKTFTKMINHWYLKQQNIEFQTPLAPLNTPNLLIHITHELME